MKLPAGLDKNEERQKELVENWNSRSDEWYAQWDYEALFRELEKDPYIAFPKAIAAVMKEYVPDLKGKKVCVPSCGDSVAVFGFQALGAKVTAADISWKQVENGRKIAEQRGLDITYYCSDSMKLEELVDETFELVYTSNGVHVWIHDLGTMYRNFHRILKENGRYIMFDTHPWSRPFDKKLLGNGEFRIRKPYEETGPFPGETTFDWRIQDFVNSLAVSGFFIERMEEFHSVIADLPNHNYLYEEKDTAYENFDWHKNPSAALPQCLGLICRKISI